jgi:predicted Rossmann-fold nucleotide-binding protein
MQTKKVQRFPVILFGSAYWRGLLDWMREQLHRSTRIDAEDLGLLTFTDSTAEACQQLLDAHRMGPPA